MKPALRSATSSGCALGCRKSVGRILVGVYFNCCPIESFYRAGLYDI